MNKLFATDGANGHYIPSTSIVIAETVERAYELLDEALIEEGLRPRAKFDYTLREIDLTDERAIILFNGDY